MSRSPILVLFAAVLAVQAGAGAAVPGANGPRPVLAASQQAQGDDAALFGAASSGLAGPDGLAAQPPP